jgi:hypothetical protein
MRLLDSAYPAMARQLAANLAFLVMREPIRKLLRRPPPAGPRRHIPVDLSVADLFAELRRQNVHYVILRWFDNLPEIEEGEDLDILVSDEDLPVLTGLLTGDKNGIPCDVYTVSGLRGTAYKRIPYYSPALARNILEQAVLHQSGCKVPSPQHHFLSLAYHALYHKGPKSGLRSNLPGVHPVSAPEHDYATALAKLAPAGQEPASVTMDMEALDECLNRWGWRPDTQTLGSLAATNSWIRQRFFSLGRRV